MQAVNGQGAGLWSSIGSATPSGTVPGGGSTLALRAEPGDGLVSLDWLEPDDGGVSITSYSVQWRTAGQAFSAGRQSVVSDTAATVTSLSNGTEYFFRVRAVNGEGNGTWSNEASGTPAATVADSAVPDRAAAPSASVRSGEATWVWAAPSDNGADISSFEFRFRVVGGSWVTRTVSLPSRTETGLSNGDTYEAQVRARNSVGQQTSWSPSGEADPVADVPDQVQFVGLSNVVSGVRVDWGVPDDGGAAVSSYDVQIANNNAFTARTEVTVTSTTRTFTAVTDGTTYYVRVRATNVAGDGAWSPTESLLRDDGLAVPDAPTGLEGIPRRPLIIDWVWAAGDDNGDAANSFEFQWRKAGQAWSAAARSASTTVGFYRLTVDDVTVDWQARVRAVNDAGTGAWAATVTVDSGDLLDAVPREIDGPVTVAGYSHAVAAASGTGSAPTISSTGGTVTTFFASGTLRVVEITGLSDGDQITSSSGTVQFSVYPQPGTG